jgi:hypothetical protein
MVSNNGPRALSPELKRSFFLRTAGQLVILCGVYCIILLCYIFFGRKDTFTSNIIFLLVIGIFVIAYTLYNYLEYRRNIYLAKEGILTQAQIIHIKAINSIIYELTYTYKIGGETFKKTFPFKVDEKSLFTVGGSLDILYNENKPKEACVARHIFINEYPQAAADNSKWWYGTLIGLLCIGLSVFEYFRISRLEEKSLDGFIRLSSIESLPYSLFGKAGVTLLLASIGLLLIIMSFCDKKYSK